MRNLFLYATIALVASTLLARAEPMVVVKTVPPGATLELRINGEVAQSAPLAPGTYRVTVEAMSAPGHFRSRGAAGAAGSSRRQAQ